MRLWHEARTVNSETITNRKEELDMRFKNTNGTFRAGIYFATNVSYSSVSFHHTETISDKENFYITVLVDETFTNR